MGKKVVFMKKGEKESQEMVLSRVKKSLGTHCACCVLITCSEPNAEGNMEIEMSFDGEESLAAFLVENASQVFDQKFLREESK